MSCLTSEKLTRHTTPILEKMANLEVEKADFCHFDYILLKKMDSPFVVSYEKSELDIDIVSLNYMGSDIKLRVDISQEVIAKHIENYFVILAKESDLLQKLNGRKLYVIFEQIPNDFYFVEKKRLYDNDKDKAFRDDYKSQKDIIANPNNIIMRYAFVEEKRQSNEKIIEFFIKDKVISKRKSWKYSIERYYGEYQMNLAMAAAELLNTIVNDLDNLQTKNQTVKKIEKWNASQKLLNI